MYTCKWDESLSDGGGADLVRMVSPGRKAGHKGLREERGAGWRVGKVTVGFGTVQAS